MQRKFISVALIVGLAAALLPATGLAAPAQQDNLLVNPGFEQPYEDGKQANGWGRWFEDTGKKSGTLDYAVKPDFSAEVNPVIVRNGSASQHIGNRYDPWHAGVKQALSVAAGTQLRFCAFGRLFANNEDFEKAPSIPSLDGQMRVGIFPNGDADWNTPGIVWSGKINPHDAWQQVCVDAAAGDAGRVTVFTSSSYRGSSAYHLDAWWDDASLTAVAQPTATAPANPPPAPPAQPQPTIGPSGCQTREDGSVIYVVQSGDTLGAIAIACNSTVEEIQRLNNLSGTLINVGQTLIVKGPTVPPTNTPAPTPEVPPTLESSPTPELTEGEICVEAFNDANLNQAKDAGEQLLGGVGFTLSDASGPKASYVTSGLEPEAYCFGGLQPGSYTVNARPPLGVVSSTGIEWPVGLTGGMQFSIGYGGTRNPEAAASNVPSDSASPADAPSDTSAAPEQGGETSNLGRIAMGGLGILVLLAAGFMAGLVLTRARR